MLYDTGYAAPTQNQIDHAALTAGGIWLTSLHTFGINCRGVANYLEFRGRANEAAFWRKMDAAVAENLAEVANGSNARTRAGILNDLLRSRMIDLKCAVDSDDNLPTAVTDSETMRSTRKRMSRGVV